MTQLSPIITFLQRKLSPIITFLQLYRWEKIFKWLLFNIVVAILPLVLKYVNFCVFKNCNSPDKLLFEQGDLLLISCAILAESMGEFFETNHNRLIRIVALSLMSVSFILVLLNMNLYADIEDLSNKSIVIQWSINIFFASLSIGFVSKLLGKD